MVSSLVWHGGSLKLLHPLNCKMKAYASAPVTIVAASIDSTSQTNIACSEEGIDVVDNVDDWREFLVGWGWVVIRHGLVPDWHVQKWKFLPCNQGNSSPPSTPSSYASKDAKVSTSHHAQQPKTSLPSFHWCYSLLSLIHGWSSNHKSRQWS